MNDKLLKMFFFAFVLLCGTGSFAQEAPGDESENGNLEDADPAAPINESLVLLSVAGISLAFYGIARKKKVTDN